MTVLLFKESKIQSQSQVIKAIQAVSGSIRQNGELAPNRARPKAGPELLAIAGALWSHPWGFNRFAFTADTFYFGHSYHPLISAWEIRLILIVISYFDWKEKHCSTKKKLFDLVGSESISFLLVGHYIAKKNAFSSPRCPLAAILILVDLRFLEEIETHIVLFCERTFMWFVSFFVNIKVI